MECQRTLPRIVIAGFAGGSGKTIFSMALLLAARRAGLATRAFKKGPDYIDGAWLGWASGNPARNLDSYLMGFDRANGSFVRHAVSDGLNVVEGARGVFDGMDVAGTHSTAALAVALRAPLLLLLNVTKVTRTAAAYVLGAQKLDPDLNIAGVVLNYVNGRRHEQIVRDAIGYVCNVPVLGAIPRLDVSELVLERHLGLVTPDDHDARETLERNLFSHVVPALDIESILRIARAAEPLRIASEPEANIADASGLKIAYLRDAAFSFYYAENLEALERAGAELIPVSALTAQSLPPGVSAVYIGGGFPEVHAAALSGNTPLLRSISDAAHDGLPIYAECGGLMLLSRAIIWQGTRYPMAGVLPFDAEVCSTAQGHGYTELVVERENPFYPIGLSIRGHEFHYSRIELQAATIDAACQVRRGTGVWQHRDGIVSGNVWASYTHVHALATPEWALGVVNAARRFASSAAITTAVS
jgi:cobyrinic acid a,c-diamide synthase